MGPGHALDPRPGHAPSSHGPQQTPGRGKGPPHRTAGPIWAATLDFQVLFACPPARANRGFLRLTGPQLQQTSDAASTWLLPAGAGWYSFRGRKGGPEKVVENPTCWTPPKTERETHTQARTHARTNTHTHGNTNLNDRKEKKREGRKK